MHAGFRLSQTVEYCQRLLLITGMQTTCRDERPDFGKAAVHSGLLSDLVIQFHIELYGPDSVHFTIGEPDLESTDTEPRHFVSDEVRIDTQRHQSTYRHIAADAGEGVEIKNTHWLPVRTTRIGRQQCRSRSGPRSETPFGLPSAGSRPQPNSKKGSSCRRRRTSSDGADRPDGPAWIPACAGMMHVRCSARRGRMRWGIPGTSTCTRAKNRRAARRNSEFVNQCERNLLFRNLSPVTLGAAQFAQRL